MTEIKNNKEEKVQNTSLMRKTKAQLVDIILRKDSVERNLRADMKSMENLYEAAQNNINTLYDRYDKLKTDYEDVSDEKVTMAYNFSKKTKRQYNLICILAAMFTISVIFCGVLYFV